MKNLPLFACWSAYIQAPQCEHHDTPQFQPRYSWLQTASAALPLTPTLVSISNATFSVSDPAFSWNAQREAVYT